MNKVSLGLNKFDRLKQRNRSTSRSRHLTDATPSKVNSECDDEDKDFKDPDEEDVAADYPVDNKIGSPNLDVKR